MSSILSSILGGGAPAGADPSQGGSVPPDLLAAIQGQQGGGQPDDGSGAPADPVAALDEALQALSAYMDVEPDEADKAIVATCIANLQKVKAKDQQESDGALQGKTSPRLMRKAAAGSAGGSGY